jgi:hypothetical protein
LNSSFPSLFLDNFVHLSFLKIFFPAQKSFDRTKPIRSTKPIGKQNLSGQNLLSRLKQSAFIICVSFSTAEIRFLYIQAFFFSTTEISPSLVLMFLLLYSRDFISSPA